MNELGEKHIMDLRGEGLLPSSLSSTIQKKTPDSLIGVGGFLFL